MKDQIQYKQKSFENRVTPLQTSCLLYGNKSEEHEIRGKKKKKKKKPNLQLYLHCILFLTENLKLLEYFGDRSVPVINSKKKTSR